MKRLDGRVAVVTGAASGIGRATAIALAEKGCHLALADVNEQGLGETASRIRSTTAAKASVHVVDVADRARMEALPDEVLAEHGHVHVLMNNAGVSVSAPVDEQSIEDWEWIVGINFWGVVYGCTFFLPHLEREDEAHVVNVSSMFGLLGLPTQGAYCATKAAVRSLSETLWAELQGTGVGVTSVHPGGIDTNIVRASRSTDPAAKEKAIRFFEARAMPPEKAAALIVEAIRKNRRRLLICPETYVTDVAKRLFPVGLHRVIGWGARAGGALP